MVTTFLDPDIFTITEVLSVVECQSLIDRAEAIGFEAASVRTTTGPRMLTKMRNNDRVVLNDVALAELMWSRVKDSLPVLEGENAVGVDSQLQFYRYFPGQQFKRHKDGAVTNSIGQTSKLSYLIYLNDDCEGGTTTFREYRTINDEHTEIRFDVSPSTGTALLFRHERWHEGTPVNSGAKYVLRSDVFYAEPGKQLPSAIDA